MERLTQEEAQLLDRLLRMNMEEIITWEVRGVEPDDAFLPELRGGVKVVLESILRKLSTEL